MTKALCIAVAVLCQLGSYSAHASETTFCLDCESTLEQVDIELSLLNHELHAEENEWNSFSEAPSSPFYERLEAQKRYENGRARLDKIRSTLTSLEKEIKKEEQSLDSDATEAQRTNLRRLQTLASSQAGIIDELQAQLEQVEARFLALDARLDAHEAEIELVSGGSDELEGELRSLIEKGTGHVVSHSETSYRDVGRVRSKLKEQTGLRRIWEFPRTEMKFDKISDRSLEFTTSVEGNLFGVVKGRASGGLIFQTQLTTEAYVLAEGLAPLLSRNGAVLREGGIFCATSLSFTFKGYGAIEGSTGVNVLLVKTSTGAKLQTGETIAVTAKRYSDLSVLPQGATIRSEIAKCDAFAQEVAKTSALENEVRSAIRVVQIPESTCYSDYDCKRDVKMPALKGSVVSQCFATRDREQAICQHRYVDTGAESCSLPGEAVYNFRYHCAKGYTCDAKSRKCINDNSMAKLLKKAGLKEARAISLNAHHTLVNSSSDRAEKFCTTYGRLPAKEGWRLPSQTELPYIGKWFREFARDNIKTTHGNVTAQSWFYPWQAYQGLVWSSEPSVYLLANNSMSRYNANDPQVMAEYVDPETGDEITDGVAICVR